MAERSSRRLQVVAVLVASLVLTLIGRLYYVQVLDGHKPRQTAGQLHDGRIVVPAPRGEIVDARGRPLVSNKITHVVTVDREAVQAQPGQGAAVLARLAALLGVPQRDLTQEITPCSVHVPSPCWTGEPFQPVPVDPDASTATVLALSEHRESYPGVAVETQTVRDYPGGALAAHLLGYTGAVSGADEKKNHALHDADTIGRSGLEEQYDSILRGMDGAQIVQLDPRGNSVGAGREIAAEPGDTLVTSIDRDVQLLAEQAIAKQIADSRAKGKPATGAAVVVMDPNTGRIVASASYPSYDPQVFIGGISVADYERLTAPGANDPLVDRAIAGAYAPGSTFKLITSSSIISHREANLDGSYPCPASLAVDGRVKTNFDSESPGYPLTLRQALQVSCDTWFYSFAANEFYADQGRVDAHRSPNEYLQHMAAAYGVGRAPGIDLPADEQASGSYADREKRLARWTLNKTEYCADAKRGFPGEPNRAYLTKLASENCTDGWRYRAGDNADMAIGQGETTVSPVQLAVAYSALVNGGRIWRPTLGWAVADASGKIVRTIKPTVRNRVPVSQQTLDYIANSLHFEDSHSVSGALAFDGSPYKTQLGAKTGTAEVFGKQDTSWFASWGPVSRNAHGHPSARFVVVGMVEQAGTGATAAAPMVRTVYDGLFGVGRPAALPGSRPSTTLPHLRRTR
ncbi:MAG TPA: penicillin-binding transpeptidase domain-containing protein [Jatrophihabitantaceae bacterium]|nr:penicillin-binding transpeptidase domain-containing protein [Jatrophihabitantaceae bacterium]